MAAATQVVQVGGQTIPARELTFGEVRAWLVEETASTQRDPVQALAFPGLGLDELSRMCDAPVEVLETFTVSELTPLVDAAKALNPPFFRVRKLLMAHIDRLSAEEAPPMSTGSPAARPSGGIHRSWTIRGACTWPHSISPPRKDKETWRLKPKS